MMRKEDKKIAKIEAKASKLAAEAGEDKEVRKKTVIEKYELTNTLLI